MSKHKEETAKTEAYEAEASTFERVYHMPKRDYDNDPEYWQARNLEDVRHTAIQQGWRPTGASKFVEANEEGPVMNLRYEVPVERAQGVDSGQAYEIMHAKVSQSDQEVYEKAVKAEKDTDEADADMSMKQKAEPSTATEELANAGEDQEK